MFPQSSLKMGFKTIDTLKPYEIRKLGKLGNYTKLLWITFVADMFFSASWAALWAFISVKETMLCECNPPHNGAKMVRQIKIIHEKTPVVLFIDLGKLWHCMLTSLVGAMFKNTSNNIDQLATIASHFSSNVNQSYEKKKFTACHFIERHRL